MQTLSLLNGKKRKSECSKPLSVCTLVRIFINFPFTPTFHFFEVGLSTFCLQSPCSSVGKVTTLCSSWLFGGEISQSYSGCLGGFQVSVGDFSCSVV